MAVCLIVNHAFNRVGIEIAQILVDKRVRFHVGVLPLAMCPGRKLACVYAHLRIHFRINYRQLLFGSCCCCTLIDFNK